MKSFKLTEAQRKLVADGLPQVDSIVRKWVRKHSAVAPYEADMRQEGALGLMRAASLFDPNRTGMQNKAAAWHMFSRAWVEERVRRCAKYLLSPTSGGKSRPEWRRAVEVSRDPEDTNTIEDLKAMTSWRRLEPGEEAELRIAMRSMLEELAELDGANTNSRRDVGWWLRNTFADEEQIAIARQCGVSRERVRQCVDRIERVFQTWRQCRIDIAA